MMNSEEILSLLSRHVTGRRLARILEVSSMRTRYLSLVIEDLYYSQNASAVLRSCDCFGVQDVHVIENYNKLPVINRHVALGTTNWLNIHRHNQNESNTPGALAMLKAAGYRIVATVPDAKAVPLYDFPLEPGKIALVFGNEREGISPEVREAADEFLTVPMVGFADSLNISVSAAVCLSDLTRRLKESSIAWRLDEEELTELRLKWVRRSARRAEDLEREYYRRYSRGIDLLEAGIEEQDIPVGDQE
jgi:tRNA (guanosine-2'-O-)-methyltransferase